MANHEAIYRGEKSMKLRETQQLVVFGVGAIGSNLVDHLTRMGFKKIAVFDKDRVEKDNIYNQVYDRKEVGKLKVEALKARVFNTTGVQLETEHRAVSKENIDKIVKKYPNAIFVDCFDNEESRQLLYDHVKNCFHVGLADNYAESAWNNVYKVPKLLPGVDICEYPQARNVVLASVLMAAEAIVRFLENGEQRNLSFTLNDMKFSRY